MNYYVEDYNNYWFDIYFINERECGIGFNINGSLKFVIIGNVCKLTFSLFGNRASKFNPIWFSGVEKG